MSPYLEGYLWPDVHQSLIQTIRELLAPKIAPKYVVHVEPYVVLDKTPESELGILYPDLAVLKPGELKEPATEYGGAGVMNPDLVLPAPSYFTVRIPRLVVKRQDGMQAVTVVEILSPVNKKEPGLRKYLKKRASLHRQGIHFLEIDLLRRGQRTVDHPQIASTDYLVQLLRAGSG